MFAFLRCRSEDQDTVKDHLEQSFPYFPWLEKVCRKYSPPAPGPGGGGTDSVVREID